MSKIVKGDSIVLKERPRRVLTVLRVRGEKLIVKHGNGEREVTRALYRKLSPLEKIL